MEITREFLHSCISNMERQRDHAHDTAVAAQAAIDVYKALISHLDTEDEELTFADLGLPEPEPIAT